MIFESIERHPMDYLPSGDKALLVAWAVIQNEIRLVLCLEDGTAVSAGLGEVKFDYRYDFAKERWVDVSRVGDGPPSDDEEQHDNANPQAGDDGGPPVQGQVPDPDRASPGDPGSEQGEGAGA